MIQSAIENGDEHAIKFTEACLREQAINPRPSYLAAARHADRGAEVLMKPDCHLETGP